MKVNLPSAQSRLPLPPQRATNPFRQTRPPAQWCGSRPNMPPSTYSQPQHSMTGPTFASMHAPTGAAYMGNDMRGAAGMAGAPPYHLSQQPDISHQIVPNENLTPDQRQRRETGLASLRKIHQMLLADENNGQPGNMQAMTDFSHINMAQDRQGPYMHQPACSQSPNNFHSFNQSIGPGPMYGPMSPAANSPMMESKPPPPYPMPSPVTLPAAPKKASRKRKSSAAPAQTPSSPLGPPVVKSEKQSIPSSPLANQASNTQGSTVPPKGAGTTLHTTSPVTGSKTPQHNAATKSEDMVAAVSGPMRGVMQQHQPVARQHSLPNLPHGGNGAQQLVGGSYRMLQAGHPTPYQVHEYFTGFCSLPVTKVLLIPG